METGVVLGLAFFLLGIALALPLAWVFLGASIIALVAIGSPLVFIAGTTFHAINTHVLMAVAFFIFAGSLMSESGIGDQFIKFSWALVGRVRGGMTAVGIVASLFIAALTGSALPSIAALIPLMVPRLARLGYRPAYTTAVLCSSCFLGYLIPPSVPVLIYCLVAQQSVAAVFLSTVVPGLILATGYLILNSFMVKQYMMPALESPPVPSHWKETVREIAVTGKDSLPALGCPVVVLGGIYGGLFTPNEAGCIAVVYTMIVGIFVYKKLTRTTIHKATTETLISLGMITVILGFGTVFTRLLTREGAAQAFASFIIGIGQDEFMVLILLNVLLLVLGMFIDGIPILIIAVPLLLPLVSHLGLNLVHLGAMVVLNVGLGVVTPPYAMSIFVGSRLSGVPYGELVKPMMWFLLLVGLPTLFLTTFVPALSLWLPTIVLGPKMVGPW